MNIKLLGRDNYQETSALSSAAFSSSEGEEEGKLLGHLTSALSRRIDDKEIVCFGAFENHSLIGCIFFTRLRFTTSVLVYMLSPVAVSTEHQRKGVGQALIRHGLDELKKRSVDVVVTYGDPAYYSRVGFEPLSESVIRAPLKLSMPIGWLGQSLTGQTIEAVSERPSCVEEFNDPVYW